MIRVVSYTSSAFLQKLREESFAQSMSPKGNCWDHAPQENFFGRMKDEIPNWRLTAICSGLTQKRKQAGVAS